MKKIGAPVSGTAEGSVALPSVPASLLATPLVWPTLSKVKNRSTYFYRSMVGSIWMRCHYRLIKVYRCVSCPLRVPASGSGSSVSHSRISLKLKMINKCPPTIEFYSFRTRSVDLDDNTKTAIQRINGRDHRIR